MPSYAKACGASLEVKKVAYRSRVELARVAVSQGTERRRRHFILRLGLDRTKKIDHFHRKVEVRI